MPNFEVVIREVHTNTIIVEAETAEQARKIGHESCLSGEVAYSHTMDFEHTTAEQIPEKYKVKANITAADAAASAAAAPKRLHGEIESEILEEERWNTGCD